MQPYILSWLTSFFSCFGTCFILSCDTVFLAVIMSDDFPLTLIFDSFSLGHRRTELLFVLLFSVLPSILPSIHSVQTWLLHRVFTDRMQRVPAVLLSHVRSATLLAPSIPDLSWGHGAYALGVSDCGNEAAIVVADHGLVAGDVRKNLTGIGRASFKVENSSCKGKIRTAN